MMISDPYSSRIRPVLTGRAYGVVLTRDGPHADEAATDRMRAALRGSPA